MYNSKLAVIFFEQVTGFKLKMLFHYLLDAIIYFWKASINPLVALKSDVSYFIWLFFKVFSLFFMVLLD